MMKIQHTIILLLFIGLPMYGQGLYDDPYASVPMDNGLTDFQFATTPAAFTNEYSVPFAAGDLGVIDESVTYGPRKIPPEIGGGEEVPDTPGFVPIGDVPLGFVLLLAGIYALAIFARTRTCVNRDLPDPSKGGTQR